MTSFTTSSRFELQEDFSNRNLWGGRANNVFDLMERAITGFLTVTLPDSDYTLVVADGIEDEARYAVIEFIGTLSEVRTVFIPAVPKVYYFRNGTAKNLTISNIVNSVIVYAGEFTSVWTDGNRMFRKEGLANPTVETNGGSGASGGSYASRLNYELANGLMVNTVLITGLTVQDKTYPFEWKTPFSATPFFFSYTGGGLNVPVGSVTATGLSFRTPPVLARYNPSTRASAFALGPA